MSNSKTSTGSYVIAVALVAMPFISYSKIADPTLLSRQLYASVTMLLLAAFFMLNRNNMRSLPVQSPFMLALVTWFVACLVSLLYAANEPEALYMLSKVAGYAGGFYLVAVLRLNN